MASRFIIIAALACCCFAASAQIISEDLPLSSPDTRNTRQYDNDRPSFIIINLGIAAPAGAYGSANILEDDAGYATPGLDLHINYGRTFNRFIGITATAGYLVQNIRIAEIVDNINRYSLNTIVYEYDYPGMRYLYAAGGLLVTIPATPSFNIDLKLQGGIAFGKDNELVWKVEDPTGIYIEKYGSATDIAFLPDIGLNFRLLVTEGFTINFFTDFVMANFEFSNVPVYRNGVPIGSYNYPLKMRNVNVGIGAGYRF